jgi:hypothetical protein
VRVISRNGGGRGLLSRVGNLWLCVSFGGCGAA